MDEARATPDNPDSPDPTVEWDGTPYPELYEDPSATTPICSKMVKRAKTELDLIVVHHLHDTGESYIRALAEQFSIRKIIGIPYSQVTHVVQDLRADFDVVVPDSLDTIPKLIEDALLSSDSPVIIQEIGGYSSAVAEQLEEATHLLGVVEDTNQGHWRWEETSVDSFPIWSIADSEVKHIEDSIVGKSIVDGLSRYLNNHGHPPLAECDVHLLGYGNIGQATAYHIDGLCRSLSVFDTDPVRLAEASTKYDVSEVINDADIIIGATGNQNGSLTAEDIPTLSDGALLVSASSRQIEFDIDGFRDSADATDYSTLTYTVDGKQFQVINNGEPINLRYSRLPPRILDLVYGLLVHSIVQIANGVESTGLKHITPSAQRTVVEGYVHQYLKN